MMTQPDVTLIHDLLLTDMSELPDTDFLHLTRGFDIGNHVNKHAFPQLKYYFDEANCHIYLIGLNDRRYFIGYYNDNRGQLGVFIPIGFINRRTLNKITLSGITPSAEGLMLKNLIYLDRASYYFKGFEVLNSSAFKFSDLNALRFGSHFVKYQSTFVISKKDKTVCFQHNQMLYAKTLTGERYVSSILSRSFKTELEKYLSSHTLPLFDKKFNKLTKKELLLLKMYNIGNAI